MGVRSVLPKPIELIRGRPQIFWHWFHHTLPSSKYKHLIYADSGHLLLGSETLPWLQWIYRYSAQGLLSNKPPLVNIISIPQNNYRERALPSQGAKGACKSALLFFNKKWNVKRFRRDPLQVYVPSNYFLSVSTLEAYLPNCQAEQACQSCYSMCAHVCECVYMCACVFHVYECIYMYFPLDELLDQNTTIWF